jgi:hypothetical protein
MKEIVTKFSEKVLVENIDNSSIVGIQWGSSNKSLVIEARDGGFTGLGNCSSRLSLSSCWVADTQKEYVERSLGQRMEVKAFEFETVTAALKWFSK